MESFFSIDYSQPLAFLLFSGTTFVIIFFRYLVLSGAYHYLFHFLLKEKVSHRILHQKEVHPHQYKREIIRSFWTSLIFGGSAGLLLVLYQKGYTAVYTDWKQYPWWYHLLSLPFAMFLHETYYYWLHRWMHRPKIYRKIHQWHHDSIETTAMTSFSFHPIESFLQALIIPILIIIVPLHPFVLLAFLLIMTLSAIINHAGVEIYPQWFQNNKLTKWLIGASHHDLHHRQFRYNFGLYFTFWDKWMNTESPQSDRWFEDHSS